MQLKKVYNDGNENGMIIYKIFNVTNAHLLMTDNFERQATRQLVPGNGPKKYIPMTNRKYNKTVKNLSVVYIWGKQ